MVTEQGTTSRKVVIDAGAAIKLQRLDRFGGELFTTGGVVREIRDEQARALLGTLPMELKVREPKSEDMAFAQQFAKATGDLGFLSRNDLELIALTVGLHREEGGTLKQRPAKLEMSEGSCRFDWAPASSKPTAAPAEEPKVQAGGDQAFSPPSRVPAAAATTENSVTDEAAKDAANEEPTEATDAAGSVATRESKNSADDEASEGGVAADSEVPQVAVEEATKEASQDQEPEPSVEAKQEAEQAAEEEASDSDGSSAGEWITQENMHRFGMGVKPAEDVRVTCATADYSVQNVLLQMGITPLTFDGFAVRSVKLWGLICRGCFHFTRDTQKVFCAKCGHDTVVRVPIIVDQDGKANVVNSGRPMRLKGSVYSIPKPQGGRAWKPIYAEDEVLIGGRDRQLRHVEKQQSKERQSRDPFNEDNATRAWYQRAGCKGPGDLPRMQAGLGRRSNPNANNFKHKNGRKKK